MPDTTHQDQDLPADVRTGVLSPDDATHDEVHAAIHEDEASADHEATEDEP